MVNIHELFFEKLFYRIYIAECEVGVVELFLGNLVVNNVFHKVADGKVSYFLRLRDAASIESAIITTAFSLLSGRGPGYVNFASQSSSGCSFLYIL